MIPREITQIKALFQAILDIAKQSGSTDFTVVEGLASTGEDLASYFGDVLDGNNSDPGPRASTHGMPQPVLDAGYEAARVWWADMVDRIEALEKSTGVSGCCVNPGLKEAFNALPAGQRGAFLDAVGAYLMVFRAQGEPSTTWRITSDILAMHASTPAEQDAWADHHNKDEVTA